ncbi:transcriptional regulator NanR [Brachybacterium horti]
MPSETAVEGAGFPLGDAARRHLAAPSTADGSDGLSRETLVDRARDAVLALIDDEHLGAGDALPSAGTLAEQFGVSKAVVREALSALAALGIVEISNGRAARVRPPDSSIVRFYLSRAIRDTPGDGFLVLMDLRAPLEVRAASLAADRLAADPDGREQLEELLARMGEALGDAEEYPRLDLELHALIAHLSGNLALQGVLDAVSGPLFRAMRELRVTREQRGLVGAEHDEHSAVVTAILAGDAAAAAAAMDAHMTAAADFAVRR